MELKERIKMIKDQEKVLMNECQFLQSRLRDLILVRYDRLMKKYGDRRYEKASEKAG